MKKLLYISMSLEKNNYGGSVVSRTNLAAIKSIENIEVIELAILKQRENKYRYEIESHNSKIKTAFNNLLGYSGRLSNKIINDIISIVEIERPYFIYLDSSLLGQLAVLFKKLYPDVKVISFFHNVELDFEVSRLKNGSLQFIPSLISTSIAEKKAVKFSDKIIALHIKDANRLNELYSTNADFIIPVCIANEDGCEKDFSEYNKNCFTVGFLGTAFFANVEAARYISDKISPHFVTTNKINFIISGNGFQNYASTLTKENVRVTGYVETLSNFYREVDVILSPITSGAGMKVKIAEAMSFNKKIIASDFTFIGYEACLNNDNLISCESLNDYIDALNAMKSSIEKKSNTAESFGEYYSMNACVTHFKNVFQGL